MVAATNKELRLDVKLVGNDEKVRTEPKDDLLVAVVVGAFFVLLAVFVNFFPGAFGHTVLELQADERGDSCIGDGVADFACQMNFKTAFVVVVLKAPEKAGFGSELETGSFRHLHAELSAHIEGDFIASDFVATDREVQVQEQGNHRVNLVTSTNGQVAQTVTAVFTTVAVRFAPELETPALQRNFKILDNAVTGAHLEAGLRPVVIPVVVESRFGGTLARFENGIKVPSCKCGTCGESRGQGDFLEHSRLLNKLVFPNLAISLRGGM